MPLLELNQLRKAFRGTDGELVEVVAIDRFEMEPGSRVALAGSSGSGKTTLLNLIAGVLRPDSGRIALDGTDLAGLSEAGRDRVRARSMGYIFQTFNLLQGCTALENVWLGMAVGGQGDWGHARCLLERVGLGGRLGHFPRQLSSGQQQRVAVARALANRPRLVLADEPTGSLDEAAASGVLDLILEVCSESEAGLLMVSHDPAVLARFGDVRSLAEVNRKSGRVGA